MTYPNLTPVTHPTLARTLVPAPSISRNALLLVGGALLIALLAQIEIPLRPIPVTMQTLGVFLVGAALGWKRGFAAVALYVLMGAVGLPVFASGKSGLFTAAGTLLPALGYLLAFPFAAAATGWLVERFALDRKPLGAAAAMLVASTIIYAVGLVWLGSALNLQGQALLNAGLTPFLIGDALKIALAAVLLPAAWVFARKS